MKKRGKSMVNNSGGKGGDAIIMDCKFFNGNASRSVQGGKGGLGFDRSKGEDGKVFIKNCNFTQKNKIAFLAKLKKWIKHDYNAQPNHISENQ